VSPEIGKPKSVWGSPNSACVPGNPHAVRVPRQRTQSLGLWVAQGDKRLDRSWERETIKDQRPTAVVGRVIWEIPVEIAAGPAAEARK